MDEAETCEGRVKPETWEGRVDHVAFLAGSPGGAKPKHAIEREKTGKDRTAFSIRNLRQAIALCFLGQTFYLTSRDCE